MLWKRPLLSVNTLNAKYFSTVRVRFTSFSLCDWLMPMMSVGSEEGLTFQGWPPALQKTWSAMFAIAHLSAYSSWMTLSVQTCEGIPACEKSALWAR